MIYLTHLIRSDLHGRIKMLLKSKLFNLTRLSRGVNVRLLTSTVKLTYVNMTNPGVLIQVSTGMCRRMGSKSSLLVYDPL